MDIVQPSSQARASRGIRRIADGEHPESTMVARKERARERKGERGLVAPDNRLQMIKNERRECCVGDDKDDAHEAYEWPANALLCESVCCWGMNAILIYRNLYKCVHECAASEHRRPRWTRISVLLTNSNARCKLYGNWPLMLSGLVA